MNIVVAIGFWVALITVIWLVQQGFSKAREAADDALLRHEFNKDGGPKITAEDMRRANALEKAFERGLITEKEFDARLDKLDENLVKRSQPYMDPRILNPRAGEARAQLRKSGKYMDPKILNPRAGDARAQLRKSGKYMDPDILRDLGKDKDAS